MCSDFSPLKKGAQVLAIRRDSCLHGGGVAWHGPIGAHGEALGVSRRPRLSEHMGKRWEKMGKVCNKSTNHT